MDDNHLLSWTSFISDLHFKLGLIKSFPGFVADSTRGVLFRECTCPLYGGTLVTCKFMVLKRQLVRVTVA